MDTESLTKIDSTLTFLVFSSSIFGSDLTLYTFLRYIITVFELRMIFLSTFASYLSSPPWFSFVITSTLPDGAQMPRREAKKYSSSLKGLPPSKEVMKEERREEEQEGIEMEGELVPAWEKDVNVEKHKIGEEEGEVGDCLGEV